MKETDRQTEKEQREGDGQEGRHVVNSTGRYALVPYRRKAIGTGRGQGRS